MRETWGEHIKRHKCKIGKAETKIAIASREQRKVDKHIEAHKADRERIEGSSKRWEPTRARKTGFKP
jgi:hypothetical protein